MTSDEFDSLAIFVAVVEELRREPFLSADNHEKLCGETLGIFCHPMFLKSAVLPFRKIWMPSERCAFRKRKKGEEGIRELVFREHPDKKLLEEYRYWFYDNFENQLNNSLGYGWAKESRQEIINLWLNTQVAHAGPKNSAKRNHWEYDLSDFNKVDARIGRERFEYLFRSSVVIIGHSYIGFEETLAFPLFQKLLADGMKPSFEADFALKYNPYPDPKYKIQFDDVFWHLNRESLEETVCRLLARQRFAGLRDFLRSLFLKMDEAVYCISTCETIDALLKESKAATLDEHSKPDTMPFCHSSTSIQPGRPQAGQIIFDAFDGPKIRFSGDSVEVLGKVYSEFRGALNEARQQQRQPDKWRPLPLESAG